MNMIHKINYIFNKKQKVRLVQLTIIIIIGAFFELLGVGVILPFINVVLDPNSVSTTFYLKFFYDLLRFNSVNDFMFFWGISLIVVYIVKNIYCNDV